MRSSGIFRQGRLQGIIDAVFFIPETTSIIYNAGEWRVACCWSVDSEKLMDVRNAAEEFRTRTGTDEG